ncbi:MAG TPA: LON peptidase substrate-binding domain-containing protein [Acidimicrobiia bacterium]|nr:LON peptidase substrate-binding domain-containing protein [Acidimicrobiia bacterium]
MTRLLPMFPLGTVLFPRAPLDLHVFEPRYRVMMHDCLRGDREFGVVLIERGSEVGGGDTRCAVGTIARVIRSTELPDGRYAVGTVGIARVRVAAWLADDPYPRAEVDQLVEGAPGPRVEAARAAAVAEFERLASLYARLDARAHLGIPELTTDAVGASFQLAAAAPIGPLDAQRLLELDDAGARFNALGALLADHAQLVEARLRDER